MVSNMLRVVVEGCCHGELDKIYASIGRLEQESGKKVDLLICCGDFQAVRNREDLGSMNVPSKYLTMASFHRYYSGEAEAPVLTLFIGGNHEASNHLQELYYGGWVAPRIYYLGCSGVVSVGGVRIGGLSGIYNARDYKRGHFEAPPYSPATIRSIYHVREVEVFKMAQIREPLDVMVSHDWPRGIYHHGDMQKLLRTKPFFRQECETNTLGSVPAEFLLHQLQPAFWFAGHLHCKFAAVVRHPSDSHTSKMTKFLALDKCLPNRDFLQLVEIPRPSSPSGEGPVQLEYDLEWLAIVRSTHHLLSRSDRDVALPKEFKMVTAEDKEWVRKRLVLACEARGQDGSSGALKISEDNFVRTAAVYNPLAPSSHGRDGGRSTLIGSPQTDKLLAVLELNHRVTIPYQGGDQGQPVPGEAKEGALFFLDRGGGQSSITDPNAIDIDDVAGDDDEDDNSDSSNHKSCPGDGSEEGEDIIVYQAQKQNSLASAPHAPPPSRAKLVLPPPNSSQPEENEKSYM